MLWVFENVVILNEMVMDLMPINISRNTVSWLFENVVILMPTMVMEDLMTLVR